MRSILKRTILLGAAAGLLLGAGACGRNRAGLLLSPSGVPRGTAAITGQLDFGSPAPHPAVLVMVARVRGTAASTFSSMELAGDFTNPTWTVPSAGNPKLTQLAPKVWADTLVLPSGSMQWKFVGNADWNSAYMSALSGTAVDGLSGAVVPSTAGGKNLIADVAATDAGTCVCTLDENANPITYAIQKVGAGAPAVFSGTDGRFTITGLVAGTYNVVFRVPGQLPFSLDSVVVGNSMKDLGTISTTGQARGSIRGALAYDSASLPITTAPYPPTTARLYFGTELLDSLIIPTSERTFEFPDLEQATYRLTLSSPVYPTADVPVTVGGGVTDLGTLDMAFDFFLLANTVNLAGDFNGWSASALSAELSGDLAWTVTTTTPIAAGVHDLKFAREGGFVAAAYGRDPGTSLTVPVTNQPTRLVSGGGSPTNAIRVDFPATGNYTFTLDERRQVFSITAAPAPQPSPRR